MSEKTVIHNSIYSRDHGLVGTIVRSLTFPFEKITWWPPIEPPRKKEEEEAKTNLSREGNQH